MKETNHPIVDMPTIRRDLYFVMSLLLADKAVAEADDMVVWTKAFHETEVRRLMLWVAAAMRSLLDLLDKEERLLSTQHCGEYWADFPNGKQKNLTFRQACNSVIHAKEILPYKVPQQDLKRMVDRVYADRITVRSTHKEKTTRTYLDIIKFVQIADSLITLFQEQDDANK